MKTRLRELRKSRNLSLRELDAKVNINYSQLARIERGESYLNQQHIDVLSQFFGVTSDYLLGKSENIKPVNKSAKKIPIYSQINVDGGNISVHVEFIQGYLGISDDIDESDSIVITANDDLMKNSGIMSGDILLISKNSKLDNNCIVAVAKGSNPVVIRKYVIMEDKKLLVSDVGIEPIGESHFIVGKVIMSSRVFK
jgi:transcriptional regulator with XRE-family HTH domain